MVEADDNWLDAEVVACPGCGARLFAVVHSPMCDDHRLYCDRCPRAIEVSYYDPVLRREVDLLPARHTWEQVMAVIEPLLRPCRCGGFEAEYIGRERLWADSTDAEPGAAADRPRE